jgi:hypothetical protein
VVSTGGLEPELWDTLKDAASRGRDLRFGPRLPTTTPSGLETLSPLPQTSAHFTALSEHDLPGELASLADRHAAFRLRTEPSLRTSLFRDGNGIARVLFVTNTTRTPQLARLAAPFPEGAPSEAVDALDGDVFRARFGALEVPLSPHSVRMLELKS